MTLAGAKAQARGRGYRVRSAAKIIANPLWYTAFQRRLPIPMARIGGKDGVNLSRTTLVTNQANWEEIAASLGRETELALDTESNSLYVYRERVCLIQIGTGEETFLLDPLAVDDLSSLGRLLADPSLVKVLHGSDYDLRSLNRDYGLTIQGLFDTQVAARFLGSATPNLASVLENSLGI